MFKLLLFLTLLALTIIEAKHFTKKLQHLEHPVASKSAHKLLEHVRRRRDVEETKSEEVTSEEEDQMSTALLKFFFAAGWQNDKLEVLSGFLEEMSDTDTNLTVVAWQRVLGDDGKVEDIRTIQLVIPPKPEDSDAPSNIVQDKDEDEDEEGLPHDKINEVKEMLEPMDQLGIAGSVTFEEFDDEGKNIHLIYMDKDELYSFDGWIAIFNKTAVATTEEVSSFVKSLKPSALGKPSILKYDVDGDLLVDQSHVTPQFLGSVMDKYEASDKMLQEAPQIIAQISQQYPREEIPKQLALHYKKEYPENKWRVLVDPDYQYITRDVCVTLTYDNFDFDENSDISYLVCGTKK